MNKSEIRKRISAEKRTMDPSRVQKESELLTSILCASDEYKNCDCIFTYISYNQEVETRFLIERTLTDGKRVAAPRVTGPGEMEFRYINSIEDCEVSSMGILEPSVSMEAADGKEKNALMIMPGLAFDGDGNRIGYGGGYYDRYLSVHRDAGFIKLAIGFDFQLLESIESEEFDVKADIVVTPSKMIHRTRIQFDQPEGMNEINRN